MHAFNADVAILMPKITDEQRTHVRYAGLEAELDTLGVTNFFAESHDSFDPAEHGFKDPFNLVEPDGSERHRIARLIRPKLVRDLTMSLDKKPLYNDDNIRVVHSPATNRFIADKARVFAALPDIHPITLVIGHTGLEMALDMIPGKRMVIKPTTGMAGEGVRVVNKASGIELEPGTYLAQEFIDTSGGLPAMGIDGVHNLRTISIGSRAIGSIARLGDNVGGIMGNDYYGNFVHEQDLPEGMRAIVNAVHGTLRNQPGAGQNVLAIDTMGGIDAAGELRDVLCEVNRRPMRISPWDLRYPKNLSSEAIIEMSKRWDSAEALMLASLVQ